MSSKIIMTCLIVILIIIYLMNFNLMENFNQNPLYSNSYENVNYNFKNQDCNQLTKSPEKCIISSVIPSNINVCHETLTNNYKEKRKKKNFDNKSLNELDSNFDLLSNFNNNNELTSHQNSIMPTENDLMIDTKSLNSLENDLLSNY